MYEQTADFSVIKTGLEESEEQSNAGNSCPLNCFSSSGVTFEEKTGVFARSPAKRIEVEGKSLPLTYSFTLLAGACWDDAAFDYELAALPAIQALGIASILRTSQNLRTSSSVTFLRFSWKSLTKSCKH